jgi:hypothetical protein
LRTKKDKFKQMSIYQSMDELWIDYGLPVAMSVLDQPP